MPKANDKITQMILDYNLKDCVGEVSIKEAINSWNDDIDSSNEGLGVVYETEEDMVNGLWVELEDEWNNDMGRADSLLQENCTLEIVRCIEDLYQYWVDESGEGNAWDTIEEKLDFVYYCEAEAEFKKAIEVAELNMEYWGG
tara:strand:+ start:39 stop:464 length:426 start_codon:yes stop_codon:yes gene_type:complete